MLPYNTSWNWKIDLKMNNPPNIKDKKKTGFYMFLKMKKADRVIEPRAVAYHLLCLAYLLGFDKKSLSFFYVLGISSSQSPRGTQCLTHNRQHIRIAF